MCIWCSYGECAAGCNLLCANFFSNADEVSLTIHTRVDGVPMSMSDMRNSFSAAIRFSSSSASTDKDVSTSVMFNSICFRLWLHMGYAMYYQGGKGLQLHNQVGIQRLCVRGMRVMFASLPYVIFLYMHCNKSIAYWDHIVICITNQHVDCIYSQPWQDVQEVP
jgi:hypothetical protein